MARFRATIKGQRGEASRLGSAKSGLSARINGWNAGLRIEAENRNDADVFTVYATGGSNHSETEAPALRISRRADGGVGYTTIERYSDAGWEQIGALP